MPSKEMLIALFAPLATLQVFLNTPTTWVISTSTKTDGDQPKGVLGHIHIVSGDPGFEETDVEVKWDSKEEKVGVFIRGRAVFDANGKQYGGNYRPVGGAFLPPEASQGF